MKTLVLLTLTLAAAAATPESFHIPAQKIELRHNRPGTLHLDKEGVIFRSDDHKHDVALALKDIKTADLSDFRNLRFEVYEPAKWTPGFNRQYTFRANPDAPVEAMAQFLTTRLTRPVIGHYAEAKPRFSIEAFKGATGRLELTDTAIRFVCTNPAKSRTWLYTDIETIGRPDKFRFRITTTRETYMVELKDNLPEQAWQFAWDKIYGK